MADDHDSVAATGDRFAHGAGVGPRREPLGRPPMRPAGSAIASAVSRARRSGLERRRRAARRAARRAPGPRHGPRGERAQLIRLAGRGLGMPHEE